MAEQTMPDPKQSPEIQERILQEVARKLKLLGQDPAEVDEMVHIIYRRQGRADA